MESRHEEVETYKIVDSNSTVTTLEENSHEEVETYKIVESNSTTLVESRHGEVETNKIIIKSDIFLNKRKCKGNKEFDYYYHLHPKKVIKKHPKASFIFKHYFLLVSRPVHDLKHNEAKNEENIQANTVNIKDSNAVLLEGK